MNQLKIALTILLAGTFGTAAPSTNRAEETQESANVVQIPCGETMLQDIGIYRVTWQSYDGQPTEMPSGWAGHFDPQTGISYQPWSRVQGRQALLMHSPWRVPPGAVWVDYDLALPPITPVWLSFGIAMGPDVMAPDKSDGVTFSCSVVVDGKRQELLHKHYAQEQWDDHRFDLTAYSGKTIQLRLQVEPGPRNNSSFDYSLFGDAQIVAGETSQSQSELIRQLTSSQTYRETATISRLAQKNTAAAGITPSNLLPCENRIEQGDSVWRFTYQGKDCRVVYTWRPATGTLNDFTAQIDDRPAFQPAHEGGVTVELPSGSSNTQSPDNPSAKDTPRKSVRLAGGRLISTQQKENALQVDWEYDVDGHPVRIVWSFGILGKALLISATCADPLVSEFTLGTVGQAPIRKTIGIPYLAGNCHYLPVQQVFVMRYLDWTRSHSSQCPQGDAVYERTTAGQRNPLFETGYVSVSPELSEVLPNIPHDPSPHLSTLGPRIMLDIWGHHRNSFAGDAENLQQMKDLGVDHVAIIQHVWQRYGYDVKLPDHLPADPHYGGDEGMKRFGEVADQCGYVWSVHENYIDLYPDAPSYDAAARVLRSDGSPSPAWFNAGTGVQSYGLKCNRALGFAKDNSPEIHRRYNTTAAYLDVHTCVPPWHQLDHEAGQPMAAMALAKVKYDTELFQFERDTHQGPLFGEGANHFYWAGLCDGVEAQVAGGEDHAPLLDFDLLKIHPQMVNHGMGYYERWFRGGYQHRWGVETGTLEDIDKYRAMELAYGHAGFVGSPQDRNWQWVVREHHLMHPIQRLYGTARVTEILYEVDGQFVTAGVAVAAGDTSRQRIRYDSGLTLWINWRDEPWQVEERVLPQWGFLALGPETQVSTTLREGHFADYAECPEFYFADARTTFYTPYKAEPRQVEPRLRSLEYLGSNRVRVTYEWQVGEALDGDYQCFVHAVHPDAANRPDHIVFQHDHGLPKPTSQWQPGDVIVDGPHEFAISDQFDDYDLTIGLFRGERLSLKGIRDTSNRVVIAHLDLQREAGKVVGIKTSPPTAPAQDNRATADFSAHRNPPGTWIDFGKLATDGSVKINRHPDRLEIFPYPRDHRFTVELDLKRIIPGLTYDQLQVRQLAAGDQRDLGPARFTIENTRLRLECGQTDVGRYIVRWE